MGNGRFSVTNVPIARPGECFVTGRTSEASGPYVDLRRSISPAHPFNGTVILSAGVIRELYREIEKASPSVPDAAELSRKAELKESYERGYSAALEEVAERFNEFLEGFNALGVAVDLDDLLRADNVHDSNDGKDVSGATEDKGEGDSTPSEPDASSEREGHKRVPVDSVDILSGDFL